MTQGTQFAPGNRLGQRKGIPALKVDVFMHQRRETCDICSLDGKPFRTHLRERGLHVEGIPQHNCIDDQAKCPQLMRAGRCWG
jgi:hypothetical protein